MGIVVLGAVFVDIKGYPADVYIPGGRNAGRVEIVHGGVSRNLVEDIANVELRPTFVSLVDTTGAGDAFFAGITMGLTYGKTMDEACEIGTRLSASVICTSENVCPRFLPSEFGLEPGRAAGEQLTFDI